MNDLFYIIVNSDVHNYADDNSISNFSNSINDLTSKLEIDSNNAPLWLKENKMIANPDKFQALILSKSKSDNSNVKLNIGGKIIMSDSNVKLLGVLIDQKLNFNKHIEKICKTASQQLNAIFRFKNILSDEAKNILVQSFVYANFNYCPLIWHFSSAKSLNMVEKLHRRALHFTNSFSDSSNHMKVLRLRLLCVEIFKTLKCQNPSFMTKIFEFASNRRPVRESQMLNLKISNFNSVSFGDNSLKILGPRVWNTLPYHIKSSKSVETFKKNIKMWDGSKCYCKKCNNRQNKCRL